MKLKDVCRPLEGETAEAALDGETELRLLAGIALPERRVYARWEGGSGWTDRETLLFLLRRQRQGGSLSFWDGAEEGFAAADRDGRVYYANAAWAALTGTPLWALLGRSAPSPLAQALAEGREVRLEVLNGARRYVALRAVPLREGGCAASARDVTRQRRMEGELSHMSRMMDAYARDRGSGQAPPGTLAERLRLCERRIFQETMERLEGNRSRAMAELGVSRRTFYRKCAELGIGKKFASREEERR